CSAVAGCGPPAGRRALGTGGPRARPAAGRARRSGTCRGWPSPGAGSTPSRCGRSSLVLLIGGCVDAGQRGLEGLVLEVVADRGVDRGGRGVGVPDLLLDE